MIHFSRLRRISIFALAGAVLFFGSMCSGGQPADSPKLVIVATTDFHGALSPTDAAESEAQKQGAPWLAGYINAIRSRVGEEKVLLLDSGDFMQGSLLSNTTEGEAVVALFNKLGFQGVALGNHEFDYGPVGPDSIPVKVGDDPLGALKARAAQAHFPFLSANVYDKETGLPFEFPGLRRSILIEKGGEKVGIVGVSFEKTATVTHPLNVQNLSFGSVRDAILREVPELRRAGATKVVVLAHVGGIQKGRHEAEGDIIDVAKSLPFGYVDLILAGHTHQRISIVVNGIPILEADAHGRMIGVAFFFDREAGDKRVRSRIALVSVSNRDERPPRPIPTVDEVRADRSVTELLASYVEKVRPISEEPLGSTSKRIWRDRYNECPLGNLVADSMREIIKGADFAMTNSGGIRSDIQPGLITYGDVYEVLPFDNSLVLLEMTASQVKGALIHGTNGERGHLQISGLQVGYVPQGNAKRITTIKNLHGVDLVESARYKVVTNDFLYHGGDGYRDFQEATLLAQSPIFQRTALVEGVRRHTPLAEIPVGRFVREGQMGGHRR